MRHHAPYFSPSPINSSRLIVTRSLQIRQIRGQCGTSAIPLTAVTTSCYNSDVAPGGCKGSGQVYIISEQERDGQRTEPPGMTRLQRFYLKGPPLHVVQRGVDRQATTFADDDIDPPKSTERHDVTAHRADHVENHGPGCDSDMDGVDKCPAIREPQLPSCHRREKIVPAEAMNRASVSRRWCAAHHGKSLLQQAAGRPYYRAIE